MGLKVLNIGAFIFLMNVSFLFSQQQDPIHLAKNNLIDMNSVTGPTNLIESISDDSLKRRDTKLRMKKSPTVAVLLSAVLPGAGQFYNQSYWKIPIIMGLAGYFGYGYIDNNNKFKDYRDQYSATITPEDPYGDQNLKALRDFYRNQRDDFVWYFITVYVINLVDAYVDAHLFDFDVKEEVLDKTGKTDKTYRLNFKIKF